MRALGQSGTDDGPARSALGDAPTWVHPPTSRYAGIAVVGDGDERCLARRLLPPVDAAAGVTRHRVVSGDRLDTIAGAELGTAELWWQIADANYGTDPVDLTDAVGRLLRTGQAIGSTPIPTVALATGGENDG